MRFFAIVFLVLMVLESGESTAQPERDGDALIFLNLGPSLPNGDFGENYESGIGLTFGLGIDVGDQTYLDFTMILSQHDLSDDPSDSLLRESAFNTSFRMGAFHLLNPEGLTPILGLEFGLFFLSYERVDDPFETDTDIFDNQINVGFLISPQAGLMYPLSRKLELMAKVRGDFTLLEGDDDAMNMFAFDFGFGLRI